MVSLTFAELFLLVLPFIVLVAGSRLRVPVLTLLAGMMMLLMPIYLGMPLWLVFIMAFFGIGILFSTMVNL